MRFSRRFLGISAEETSLARRGFRGGDVAVRRRLEQIGRTFLAGYHAALEEGGPLALGHRLAGIEAESRGFAHEGAGMGLALLDHLTPWNRDRLRAFLDGAGAAHAYMVHVGAGWAFARLPWLSRDLERPMARLDPLLRWLAADGYGFHEGYFHWRRSVEGRAVPRGLSGYARRAFDQGLGRSLWFVDVADVARIPATIAAFPAARQADLWSGVGLACAYAGGVDGTSIAALRDAAGPHRAHLAQGAVFAAKARERAGNRAPHTEDACRIVCAMSAEEASRLADVTLDDLPAGGAVPPYEAWRRRIRERLRASCEAAPWAT